MIAQLSPLGTWLAGKARGAICVSTAAADAIRAACPGRVVVADAIVVETDARRPVSAPSRRRDELRILALVEADNVRRIVALVTTIGVDPRLNADTHVFIHTIGVGRDDLEELGGLAARLGVRLTSADPNAAQAADLVMDLRDPRIEAPAPAVLSAIAQGIPVVVSGNGFANRIPDDIAMKVDATNEFDSLRRTLNRVKTEARSPGVDDAGRSWLRQITDTWNLADTLIDVVTQALTIRPVTRAIDRIGRILAGWQASPETIDASGSDRAFDLFEPVFTVHAIADTPTIRANA